MKRFLMLIITIILSLSVLVSCSFVEGFLGNATPEQPECKHVDANDDYLCDHCGNSYYDGDDTTTEDNENENQKPEDEKPNDDTTGYVYKDFTPSEKALFNEYFGEIIPFVKNNEYYVEEYTYDYDDCYEEGINFYTYGNTKAEFNSYKALFSSYTYEGSEADEYGDLWYFYVSDSGFYIDISYYETDDGYVIDVYVYLLFDYEDGGSTDNGGNNGGNNGDNSGHSYTDFTSSEKALFNEYFGEIIPFVKNNEYYVEEYTYDYDDCYEEGINFYTYGNTKAEFNSYKALFSSYTYEGSEADEYGDLWYFYVSDSGFYIDISYYETDDGYVIDVYVYFLYDYEDGGSDDNGNNGGNNGGSTTPDNLITNAGAGLPSGTNGVYDIDFTTATNVKDVTDQGNYIDGCPTVGSPKVLVIPVDFTDINGRNKGYSIENIIRAFKGGSGETDYYSVYEYYLASSYGKLNLDITVIDEWFIPKNTSTYYANATYDYYGDKIAIGDQLIMDEALAYLSKIMDLSKFDSDGNAIIDAVVLVTTLEIDDTTDFYWAYRYWNLYTDDEGYYYEYDGVSANDYMWASYSFMHESYDEEGYVYYTDTSVMNTYTYIHEFGHILGLDDYYNTGSYGDHPMDGYDMMDGMMGDHNAFSKFNLGWITTSKLVKGTNVTITLDKFSKNGDTIILANNWDSTLGAYQEYYIVVYYTNDGLNSDEGGLFARDGILVYHINSSLYCEEYDGEIYYDIYNNNTHSSDQYGTEDNLIEFVLSGKGNYTYVEGDTLPQTTDDQGNKLGYTFVVDSLDENQATITFTKR